MMLDPIKKTEWSRDRAALLLSRACFGCCPREAEAAGKAGLEATLDGLFRDDDAADLFPVPENVADPAAFADLRKKAGGPGKNGDPEAEAARKKLREEEAAALRSLRAWWLQRMRYAPQPLRENLALFWHGHFATSVEKVRGTHIIWKQNELFRSLGLGSLGDLARAVARDPAMMRYLDVAGSKRAMPNENFAREVMELFLLGEGHYSERDIKEAARAFTGFRIDPETMEAQFIPRQHDDGEKTVLGRTGRFGPDEIVDILIGQPECARFIAGKLWVYFVGKPLPETELAELAAGFRASGCRIAPTVRRILSSEGFYASRGTQIKSPVQWLVGSAKALEFPLEGNQAQQVALRDLGQDLFAPPNVKGWEGGRSWISSSTLLARCNLAGSLFVSKLAEPEKLFAGAELADPSALCASAQRRLLVEPAAPASREAFAEVVASGGSPVSRKMISYLLRLVMSAPEYQIT